MNLNKALIGGALTLALTGSYYLFNTFLRKPVAPIPREKALAYIKQIRKQMFISFMDIAGWVNENSQYHDPNSIRNFVMSKVSPFKKRMDEKYAAVLGEISPEDFEEIIKNYYSNDPEIQYHIKMYQEEFQKAILGVVPDIKQETATFISRECLLKMAKQIFDAKIHRISEKVYKGIPVHEIQEILKKDKKNDQTLRVKKLQELGLTAREPTLSKIFQFCFTKYMRMDRQFIEDYNQITEQYEQNLRKTLEVKCLDAKQ